MPNRHEVWAFGCCERKCEICHINVGLWMFEPKNENMPY